ncbi:alpha/beta hydrolase [Lysinibacter sp. HNR]|uniref:alpha/beta hydrolase n=1 Tax=Lysinibacter sp. HNR TaxID=3031408 RepID=UPI0024356157|nr:alpha/beta hydrolase [Lysinibacter sp. HNR]WGD36446.1 alpha/beta hydrolase [Lysinibacter sp. HNR]
MVDSLQGWVPDVLGGGYQQRTLHLDQDDEGQVVTTLVRAAAPAPWPRLRGTARLTDVVYVHGWSDYFFQKELADFWRERGARFYAVDLRKYGRSLREGQTPGYIEDLTVYDADIEAALAAIGHGAGQKTSRKLVLMGHSTGGLVLTLWAARHPNRASSLILNSPWLELQTREIGRIAFAPMNTTLVRLGRKTAYPQIDKGMYTRSLHKHFGGEWEYDMEWKPEQSFAIYPGWLNAIIRGHQSVARGLGLTIPVLIMLSKRSVFRTTWDESMRHSDTVLSVEGVANRAKDVGECVTLVRLTGALHDVFLSEKLVRDHAYQQLDRWIRSYL